MTERDLLDLEMRELLLAIELCSHVPAAQIGYSTGRSEHPSRMLAGGDKGAEWLSGRYNRATDNTERARLIVDARAELLLIRGAGIRARDEREETPDKTIARMLNETAGWAPEDVEQSRWKMPARMVRRHRVVAGRDADTGYSAPEHATDDLEPLQRARELADKGLSIRQIAMLIAKDPRQVQRYLQHRAA